MRAVAVRLVGGGQRGARRRRQPAAAGNALLLDEQLFDGGHGGDLRLEFGELIAQEIEARAAILGGGLERLEVAAAQAIALVTIGTAARGAGCRTVLSHDS